MADSPPPSIPNEQSVRAPVAKSEWRQTIWFIVRLAVIALVLRSFVFAPFNIPSQSMLPRLYIGDFLFVSKWNYGYSRYSLPFSLPLPNGRLFARNPARGDVVVFRGPAADNHNVIKRVIGLPGDSVQMRQGQVVLNGTAVPKTPVADFAIPLTPNYPDTQCPQAFQAVGKTGRAICRYAQFRETLPNGKSYLVLDRGEMPQADDTPVYTVPAGHVFVLGDNRDDSGDSRFEPPGGMGFVPIDKIEGRAAMMFWSTDGTASWILPWTWFTATRWGRIGGGF